MHSVDCVDGNSKSGPTFWGQISDTYNATTDPLRHRTAKQLKDHWSMYNARVSLFNAIYNQEVSKRQSGADDDMVMDEAKARYAPRAGHEYFRKKNSLQLSTYMSLLYATMLIFLFFRKNIFPFS